MLHREQGTYMIGQCNWFDLIPSHCRFSYSFDNHFQHSLNSGKNKTSSFPTFPYPSFDFVKYDYGRHSMCDMLCLPMTYRIEW